MLLKEIRIKRNLTQQSVADRLGCSPVTYNRYENGSRQPSIETLLRLADLFGVAVDALLGRKCAMENTLSDYEVELISAARHADERARADALQMLLLHNVREQKKNLA